MFSLSNGTQESDSSSGISFATVKTTSTPMEPNKALIKDEEVDSVDVYLYRSMIRSLMYLTASRPDIMFAVCACARFQVTLKMSHLHAMKRIFRYLKGQPKLGLWYPRDSPFDLEASSDNAQTRFETTFKKSNDPPLSRGYTLGSGEDSMKLLELMELCTKSSDLVSKKKREMSSPFWNEIEVNAGNSNLMLLALVTAAGLLTTVRHNLVLPVQVNAAEGDSINTSIQAKAKTVNGEHQLQALVDKKKVIITETSIRSDPHLEDTGGTDYLPTATIFEELARMGRKHKKTTAVPHPSDSTVDVPNKESVPTHSNDLLLSGEYRLKLTNLMDMCTKLSNRVLDLEHTKTAQAQEITNLMLEVKKLEKKAGLRTHKFKRLYKVGVTRRVEYSDDESLGTQEDASNQGRSIEDIDKYAEVSLVDETQGRSDDAEMFDTDALIGNEVFAKNYMIKKDQDVIPKEVSIAAPSTTVVPPPVIIEVEITLAQTLAKLNSAKSKVVIQELVESTATTAPSTIPKAKGITFRDVGESTTRTPTLVSSSSIKDKGKAKMDELEVPLKKKDQIALDEEMARNLKAQIQAKLIEEERLARKKEEEANIALIESWDNT
ncbi:hypothetical protein Tco_0967258 [Tanacetum coccineum]